MKLYLPLLVIGTGASLMAADHSNLEENLPTRMEDAYPIAYRGREFQFFTRYARLPGGRDQVIYHPRLEFGIARNWQASLASDLFSGSADASGNGDLTLDIFRNLNQETLSVPAFAVAAGATLPTGNDSAGLDPHVKLIATKTIGRTSLLQRVHGNVIYRHNSARMSNQERADRVIGIIGYSVRLGPNTMLVTDFYHEQLREKGKSANVFEGGVRMQLNPLTVLVAGVGVGVGPHSPDVRVTFGIQRALTLFWQ